MKSAALPSKEGKILLILAFETSAKAVGVALHDGQTLLATIQAVKQALEG